MFKQVIKQSKKRFLNPLFKHQSYMFGQRIGVPREIHEGEKRVSISPEGAKKLTDLGYEVLVEKDAGLNSEFTNEMYEKNGAKITDVNSIFKADLMLKVRPPSEQEISKLTKNQTIISMLQPGQN